MAGADPSEGGVVLALARRCPRCDRPVVAKDAACKACGLPRPEGGWKSPPEVEAPTDPGVRATVPPPPVKADAPRRRESEPRPRRRMSTVGLYARLLGAFVVACAVSTAAVVYAGLALLPEPARQRPYPPVISPVVVPSAGLTVPVAQPAPAPDPQPPPEPLVVVRTVEVPVPVPVSVPAPAPAPPRVAAPEPVPEEPDIVEPDIVEPEPEPAPPPVPAQAAALDGVYVGRAAGSPFTLELTFSSQQNVYAVLRVASRTGTEVRRVRGTYTLAPDGSADFALADRTDDGVVGYSGTVSGTRAEGLVTLDGRRKGRFSARR